MLVTTASLQPHQPVSDGCVLASTRDVVPESHMARVHHVRHDRRRCKIELRLLHAQLCALDAVAVVDAHVAAKPIVVVDGRRAKLVWSALQK